MKLFDTIITFWNFKKQKMPTLFRVRQRCRLLIVNKEFGTTPGHVRHGFILVIVVGWSKKRRKRHWMTLRKEGTLKTRTNVIHFFQSAVMIIPAPFPNLATALVCAPSTRWSNWVPTFPRRHSKCLNTPFAICFWSCFVDTRHWHCE